MPKNMYEICFGLETKTIKKILTYLDLCPYHIALDKALFSTKMYLYFSYFSMKTYVVGTH